MHVGELRAVIELDSPCVNVCTIKDDLCIGCGRTLEEIANWTAMTNDERKLINARLSNNIQRT
jgi:predicted Fe-S protein YdhL (DUF1289 family)